MGLDMYLNRCNRKAWGFKNVNVEEAKDNNPKLYEEIKPYLHERGEHYRWESIFEDVGYWRKANAIHRWFVENVQGGVDDCGCYEVSKEQLEELLAICIQVRDKSKMADGMIENGYTYENGKREPIMESGKYIANSEIAAKLLPTTSGFFFGSTNYDEWYMEDIKHTIDVLTKVLETTDFDLEVIAYDSSW
jgi:hypothetical protein